eukprot:141912-Chlamydomonas_euryale.AAC.8
MAKGLAVVAARESKTAGAVPSPCMTARWLCASLCVTCLPGWSVGTTLPTTTSRLHCLTVGCIHGNCKQSSSNDRFVQPLHLRVRVGVCQSQRQKVKSQRVTVGESGAGESESESQSHRLHTASVMMTAQAVPHS